MYSECRHIMPSGRKCHSPALRNQPYCYYHQNLHRYSNPPNPDKLAVFPIEDVRGIQIALTQVLAALNSPYMDNRRAGLLLYGLQIAAQLAKHVPALEPDEAVRTCEETAGVALAPEKSVCEPPCDCRDCPRQHTCENYEEPEEEEQEEEEEEEQDTEEQRFDEHLAGDDDNAEDYESEEEDFKENGGDTADDEPGDDKVVAENEAALIRKARRLLESPRSYPATRSTRSAPI